ncbi:MAG: hypothetical protein A3K19_14630 [Lentisphaerae bacterium RIFOXYB12_FULL_65_16]|nr:MAG: hypothetical protein A3K18_28695 [Lentisphaerae bacterium RIFOXYA12_64_32]OGV87458.1 MAG: hypothetical protein A3K19_14630 [Lentisphaerae bacterium RIFOXYB12_FULL_65_16]
MAAVEFRRPDRIPVQIHSSSAGLYEHGQKLLDLMLECGHDFGDLSGLKLPQPPPEEFDADGKYHVIKTDEWGVKWEYLIYGIWGHDLTHPLADLATLATYKAPPPPALSGPGWEAAKVSAAQHRQQYFNVAWAGDLWERMHFLRGYEDTLVDIMSDTPEINRIADLITERNARVIEHGLSINADAICFGDDFGTQQAPIFPPDVWRRFFKPRYARLFEPIRRAGTKIFFHSCGQILPLLEDFAELGVNAIWPQLPLFDQRELARRCRELRLAVQLHPDRGELMQRRTAQDVRDYIPRLLENFDTAAGGSWLYLEIDPGFKWECAEALYETAIALRG